MLGATGRGFGTHMLTLQMKAPSLNFWQSDF